MLRRNPGMRIVDIREESEVGAPATKCVQRKRARARARPFVRRYSALARTPSHAIRIVNVRQESGVGPLATTCVPRNALPTRVLTPSHMPARRCFCKQVAVMPIPAWWKPIEIPRGTLERDIAKYVPDLSTELVCVCAGGSRSGSIADFYNLLYRACMLARSRAC